MTELQLCIYYKNKLKFNFIHWHYNNTSSIHILIQWFGFFLYTLFLFFEICSNYNTSPLPSLLSNSPIYFPPLSCKFMSCFFYINCYSMHIYLNIHKYPKYNLLSPYNAICIDVFRVDCLTLDWCALPWRGPCFPLPAFFCCL